MSARYEWVTSRPARSGRAAERADWSISRARPPEALRVAPGGGGSAPGGSSGGDASTWPAPTGRDALWQPIGPITTVQSGTRVTGRVRDLAVSDDGRRAYAVSALGGLWYSEDAGASWEPVGAWRTSDQSTVAASSHTLSGGAIHVHFGADATRDEVWLGTGEPQEYGRRRDRGFKGHYGGVGILHQIGPVARARVDPLADPWEPAQALPRDAAGGAPPYKGLRGQGFFRFAADPDTTNPGHLLAATTAGLHRHDPAAPAGADPWSLVAVDEWEELAPGGSAQAFVTDVAWLPSTPAHGSRVWLVVVGTDVAGVERDLDGLWYSTAGGAYARIRLPGLPAETKRLTLASHPGHPDVLYVLGTGPRLWRVDGAPNPPVAARVRRLPSWLFGRYGDQSGYDSAAAIDPADPSRVMIGGASATPGDGAALYRLTVTRRPGGGFISDYEGGNARDPTWVGSGVHPDVHAIRWREVAGKHVWIGCDGGVFRSARDGMPDTFVARNTGLSVSEPGSVANHPISPAPVLAGMQDTGTLLRIGEGVWRDALKGGDGGGCAFDPGDGGRFVAQAAYSLWRDHAGNGISPTLRSSRIDYGHIGERNRSRMYSNAAAIRSEAPPGGPVTRLAIGTDRVWYSTRWGFSWKDGPVWRRSWVTLPTGTDPRAGDADDHAARTQDRLERGPEPWGSTQDSRGIRALRWQTPERLLTLSRGKVHALTIGGSAPQPEIVAIRVDVPSGGVPRGDPPPAEEIPGLPGFGEYNDLCIHDPAAGSFYLATSHPLEPLWWWDGTSRCHPTGLGAAPDGSRSPGYSAVVDPLELSIVYAGTTTGVWQGRLSALTPGAAPTWEWRKFTNGLPEAAAQDLSIGSWPGPGAGDPPLRLLRVALQSRGLFEVDLNAPAADQTYLRAHAHDTRRILPTPIADPLWPTASHRRRWALDWDFEPGRDRRGYLHRANHPDGTLPTHLLWHASPDIVARPRRVAPPAGGTGPVVPAPPGLPWRNEPADRFWLWSLQTAIRALPEATAPDAPLVVADGRWTEWWVRHLRSVRAALGLPNPGRARRAVVDAALWNHLDVQAGFWAEPWADAGPTEADLIERVVGMVTPREGDMPVLASSAAALGRPYAIDVCLHHRGLNRAGAGQVAVTLLRTVLDADPATWATLPAPDLTGLAAALDALPADATAGSAPGALPGWVPPRPWTFADQARPARRPSTATSAARASVVSFDVDFSADADADADILLLALVHRQAEPVGLVATGSLRDGVLASSQAAARSLRVIGP